MIYTIENDKIRLSVDTKAAEIHSLQKQDDSWEYMWQGNPEYWSGRNPILFPQVSGTVDNMANIDGHKYPMAHHGFARHEEFELINHDKELTLELKENKNTLAQYPFKFSLKVNYKLENSSVVVTYTITNNDNKMMPFGFGLHPGFNCAVDNNGEFVNTKIIFEKTENHEAINENELVIKREVFDKYITVILKHQNSSKATFITDGHKLEIGFKDFRYLGVWSKTNSPFLCLEPWLNLTDRQAIEVPFDKREEEILLEPNNSVTYSYSITI